MKPIVIRRRCPKRKVNDALIQYARNETSQSGEDGILEEIFRQIEEFDGKQPAEQRDRWCAEFGCWDGRHLCNTHNLIKQHGFKGILIEADTEKYKQLVHTYKHEIEAGNVLTVNEMVAFNDRSHCSLHALYPNAYNVTKTPPKSPTTVVHEAMIDNLRDFDEIIDSLNVCMANNRFDLIVIDIDGADYHVFDSMVKHRAKVVMIEFNPTIPNNIVFIQPRDINIQQGNSLRALIELAQSKDYELVCTTTYNAIFVDRYYFEHAFKHKMPSPDNSIDKMHDVPMETQLFQLYDGTLKIEGCKKLVWHKVKIDESKIQVLPPDKRSFPFPPVIRQPHREHTEMIKQTKPHSSKNKHRHKLKRVYRTASSTLFLLKAMTFVGVGFVLGRIYQKQVWRNNEQ